jgi:hypothetical protein
MSNSYIRMVWYWCDDNIIKRAQVKVGLINLCKGLFSLNACIYYSIAHRQAVCILPGGYSTILPHKGVHCSNWFLSDDARWACLEESTARSLNVISLLLQSTTHCRYRVYTKFLLTYTAIYRRNRKVLPLEITALQPQSHFHLGTPYINSIMNCNIFLFQIEILF